VAAATQKRDKSGRFADEGKGAITDAQTCAAARKKLIRLDLQMNVEIERHSLRVADIEEAEEEARAHIREWCS
jgi:hypothetical protein